jgi:hypothetical protein
VDIPGTEVTIEVSDVGERGGGDRLQNWNEQPREPDQRERVAPKLGRTAVNGARRHERQERAARTAGRLATERATRDEPPREERPR